MNILRRYLDSDTTGIVCEFLINGDDYTPFTLEDIRQLEKRIYNWFHCMQWAARVGNIPILKYVGKKKIITGLHVFATSSTVSQNHIFYHKYIFQLL